MSGEKTIKAVIKYLGLFLVAGALVSCGSGKKSSPDAPLGLPLSSVSSPSISSSSSASSDSSPSSSSSTTSSTSSSSTSTSSTSTSSTSSSNNGDPVTATVAASEMGKGVNLGQMFDNTQHPRTLAAARAKIDAYYDIGFRNIQIPITWTETVGSDLLVTDPTTGELDTANPRLAVIESVIDHALSLPGLYVVINAHHEKTLKTQDRWQALENLWDGIATRFADKSFRLIYEILNEPHLDDANNSAMSPALLRNMTGRAYDKIRSIDQNRIVIFGGNQWFGYHEVPAVWTNLDEVGGGADDYLMVTFHHYNPWSFNGDNQGDYDDNWTDYDIHHPMDVMEEWANTIGGGMPVYIGEWGVGWHSVLPTMDCNNIRLWYSRFHEMYAEPKGMPTAVWDDGGWFGVFNHSAEAFTNDLAQCINGECEWTGTERFNDACRQ